MDFTTRIYLYYFVLHVLESGSISLSIQSGIPKVNAHAVENLNFFSNRAGNQRATCES